MHHPPTPSIPNLSLEPSPAPLARVALRARHAPHLRFRPVAHRLVCWPSSRSSSGRRSCRSHGPTALERVRASGKLRYGSDMEGGGPYAYPDPTIAARRDRLRGRADGAAGQGAGRRRPCSRQGQWDKLLQVLGLGPDRRRSSTATSGPRAARRDYLATRPYYVYQLQLMVPRGGPIRSWADLKQPQPGGGRWTVGVLVGSAADTFAAEQGGPNVRGRPVRRRDRRDDRRAERPVSTRRSRTCPRRASTATGSPASSSSARPSRTAIT